MSADDWHGTPGGAMRHWRAGERPCEACLTVKRRIAKGATLDRERGNPRMVVLGEDAHQIIASTPRDQLARATGLAVHKLCRMEAAGPDQKVYRRTRDRILAAASVDFWTPVGVQRRLRALHAIGWSTRAIALEMGTEETTLRNLVRREHPQFVRRTYAERIIATYDRLSMTPRDGRGGTRARNMAAEKGWAPPLAWDRIDDPNEIPTVGDRRDAEPDPVVVERLIAGHRVPSTQADKVEAMRRWMASGRSQRSLCTMHGWQESRYVERQDGAA